MVIVELSRREVQQKRQTESESDKNESDQDLVKHELCVRFHQDSGVYILPPVLKQFVPSSSFNTSDLSHCRAKIRVGTLRSTGEKEEHSRYNGKDSAYHGTIQH